MDDIYLHFSNSINLYKCMSNKYETVINLNPQGKKNKKTKRKQKNIYPHTLSPLFKDMIKLHNYL